MDLCQCKNDILFTQMLSALVSFLFLSFYKRADGSLLLCCYTGNIQQVAPCIDSACWFVIRPKKFREEEEERGDLNRKCFTYFLVDSF